jgi:hypothetical protein
MLKNTSQKIGIVLILTGFCLPLLMFPFATKVQRVTLFEALGHQAGYSSKAGIIETIQNSEIVLRKGRIIDFDDDNLKGVSKISIPYKYVWAAGVLCLFAGIGFLLLDKSSRSI